MRRILVVPPASEVQTLVIRASAQNSGDVELATDEVSVGVGASLSLTPRLFGLLPGESREVVATLSAPALEEISVALSVADGSIATVTPAVVLIPANETQAVFTVTGSASEEGSTSVAASSALDDAGAIVSVSTIPAGKVYPITAPGIRTRTDSIETVARLLVPGDRSFDLVVPLLDAPATGQLDLLVDSNDPALVSVGPGAAIVPAGSQLARIPIRTAASQSPPQSTELRVSEGGRVMLVRVTVVDGASDRVSVTAAPAVRTRVVRQETSARLFVPNGSTSQLWFPLGSDPPLVPTTVRLVSSRPSVLAVPESIEIATGESGFSISVTSADLGASQQNLIDGKVLVAVVGDGISESFEVIVGAGFDDSAVAPSMRVQVLEE